MLSLIYGVATPVQLLHWQSAIASQGVDINMRFLLGNFYKVLYRDLLDTL